MDRRHRPRIVIADDHTLVAEACKKLLEVEFQIAGIVASGRELIEAAARLKPEVVIVDPSMPDMNGLLAVEKIKQDHRSTKVIILTMNQSAEVAAEAFRKGASGFVLKRSSADELVIAVRWVLRGDSYLSPLITEDTVNYLLKSGFSYSEEKKLSARQREILQLLAEGKSTKEIAYLLALKQGTIAFHKTRLMEVLGFKSNAELLDYSIRKNIVAKTSD